MNGVVNHDESSAYDGDADDYEVARPGYPADVFDTIEHYGDFNEPPRVVEVGSGTGQATRQMTARGWTVHGIEPGPRLAETARTHVPCPNTRFEVTRFEDAVLTESSFDLVAAATSWHWVETDIGYRKAHSLLKPSGKIALFWNAHVPHTTNPAREPIRDAYLDVAPELADPRTPDPRPPRLRPRTRDTNERLLRPHQTPRLRLRVAYPIDRFLRLIDTYASHHALDPRRRSLLHSRLRIAADDQLSGTVTKPYETLLLLGTRR